jgi:class 3 adenylate cyclase
LPSSTGPGRAIRCATALRDRLRGIGIQIRAGLHTGEVQFRDADVGGIAVHSAARVLAAAGPGEVLVSRIVHDLVTGSDYVLEDRGDHTLRGMAGEWRLFAGERLILSAGPGRTGPSHPPPAQTASLAAARNAVPRGADAVRP